MMKFRWALPFVFLALAGCKATGPGTGSSTCFKGRLEVKGMCSNYTIKLLRGNLDTAKLVAAWKNEITGKTYTNVFALGSPCDFPATLKEGDEFYFTLSDAPQTCAVCLAYYPKPEKALSIKVLTNPCN